MYVIILVTCPKKREALKIAEALLKARLVACVNITDKVDSFFRWEGHIDRAREHLLVAKSTRAKMAKIVRLVKSLHSYKVPEIVALPVIGGNKNYLDWIDDSIR